MVAARLLSVFGQRVEPQYLSVVAFSRLRGFKRSSRESSGFGLRSFLLSAAFTPVLRGGSLEFRSPRFLLLFRLSERLLRKVHCVWGLLYYGFLLEVFVLVLGFIGGLLGVVGTVVYQG